MTDLEEPTTSGRRLRRARKAFAEALGELVGELAFGLAAFLVLAAVAGATTWGWHRAPLLTSALAVLTLAFLGFGAWAWLAPGESRGRLAGVAAATFLVAVTIVVTAGL